jgi:hypothetical protein
MALDSLLGWLLIGVAIDCALRARDAGVAFSFGLGGFLILAVRA